jgi:hypothetical protein
MIFLTFWKPFISRRISVKVVVFIHNICINSFGWESPTRMTHPCIKSLDHVLSLCSWKTKANGSKLSILYTYYVSSKLLFPRTLPVRNICYRHMFPLRNALKCRIVLADMLFPIIKLSSFMQ